MLYWPLELALHTDINYLLVSYAAHVKQLNLIFGGGETPPKGPPLGADGKALQPRKLTTKMFDALFPGKLPSTRRAKVK